MLFLSLRLSPAWQHPCMPAPRECDPCATLMSPPPDPDPLSQATQRDARAEDRMGEKEREEVGRSPSGASREPRKGVLPEGAVCGSKCRQMESGANGN